MRQVVNNLSGRLARDLPPFALALVTAELLFKFGSFTLECFAFLALWWALAQGYQRAITWFGYRPRISAPR